MSMGEYQFIYNLWRIDQQAIRKQNEDYERKHGPTASANAWDNQLSEKWRPKKDQTAPL